MILLDQGNVQSEKRFSKLCQMGHGFEAKYPIDKAKAFVA